MNESNQIDLSEIRRLYRDGVNIMTHLKRSLGTRYNTDELVEISYDMQAGSYVRFVEANPARAVAYQNEVATVLGGVIETGDSVIDVGTGEMTTLAPVAALCYADVSMGYAVDISLSRLAVGRKYLRGTLHESVSRRIQPVVATMFKLPLADGGVDVVWTSHALEPNGGRELEAIAELARVARKYLVLFEPSYERNSPEGRQRMEQLGYVRNLEGVLAEVPGLELVDVIKMVRTENELNPTYAHVIRKTSGERAADSLLRCPVTHGALVQRAGYLYSAKALLAYPVIEGIPVLRPDKGICASILEHEDFDHASRSSDMRG
jgi:uncharacterized protein YbaR (Trm112 family)